MTRDKLKVLIFGGSGWLAQRLYRDLEQFEFEVYLADRSRDITNPELVSDAIVSVRPDVVINAAGKTGRPNIDWCEDNKVDTWRSNVLGPQYILEACLKHNVRLVHLSSGCIFDGVSPKPGGFTEEDKPNPVSYYGVTKVEADKLLEGHPVLILRLRMPIDNEPSPRNLITKLAGYSKIIDATNSVTVVDDLVSVTAMLIRKGKTGIYNIVNPGPVRHWDIMEWYKRIVDPNHKYEMIPPEELLKQGLATAGRSNCVLSTAKLENDGIILVNAEPAIKVCLKNYAQALKIAK